MQKKKRMKQFDVTIAGEINLDLILYGLPEAMALEKELLATDFQATLGSSSAIVAHNLAVLGMRVGFITLVGADDFGSLAVSRLSSSGVDLSRVQSRHSQPATGITILLQHGKTRHILTYPGTTSHLRIEHLDLDYLKRGRHFHLSSLFLQRGLMPDLLRLFTELKHAGLTISLDTNDDPADEWDGGLGELLPLVDVLLPNETEACRIAGQEDLEAAIDVLRYKVPCVAIKRGSHGAIVQRGDERVVVPAIKVNAIDSIGAGDSFDAGFLSAWLRRLPLGECAHAGNVAGALSTLRPGGTEAFRNRDLTTDFLKAHKFPDGNAQ